MTHAPIPPPLPNDPGSAGAPVEYGIWETIDDWMVLATLWAFTWIGVGVASYFGTVPGAHVAGLVFIGIGAPGVVVWLWRAVHNARSWR